MPPAALIIGSQGVLGSLVADAFRRDGWAVTGTSRRPNAPDDVRRLDLTVPGAVDDILDDVKPQVVVTSVPDATLAAERAVLHRGGLILNTSTLPARDMRRLSEAAVSRTATGTAVPGAGIAPGLVNLVAADLLAQWPDADEIEMAFTNSVKGNVGAVGAEGGYDALTAAARHPTKVFPLPAPIGRARCLRLEALANWFGPVADGRATSLYTCIDPRPFRYALLAVNAVGLLRRIPRSAIAANAPATPSAASTEPVAHWVAVRRNGTLLAACTVRCQGDYRSSAAITALFARALTESPANGVPTGVLFPEQALSLDDLRLGLAGAGVTIHQEPFS